MGFLWDAAKGILEGVWRDIQPRIEEVVRDLIRYSFGVGDRAKITVNGREFVVKLKVKGRFHSPLEWVYDCKAKEATTGLRTESKHWKSADGAKEHALESLLELLVKT